MQLDGAIESGLRLAYFLGDADLAILKWDGHTWIVRGERRAELAPAGSEPPTKVHSFAARLGDAHLELRSDGHDFQAVRDKLASCTSLLARALAAASEARETERYRSFLRESVEGVWRIELRKPLPSSVPEDDQVQFMFEQAFMAECNPAMARMYGYDDPAKLKGFPLNRLLIPDEPKSRQYLVILGFADLALDKPDLSAETKGYISSIRRNAEQLSKILGGVLDMSKIEASRLEVERIRFPLVPMISEVIGFLDLHAREKGLHLSLDKIGALPKIVSTDPTRLRQILTNLISNAIKFTENGYVKVSMRMTSAARQGTPVALEFKITDSGIGIPLTKREKLFRPYAQAETSTTRRFGGTGLGLHLAKKLAQALGGDLKLEQSEPGQGSTFMFTVNAGDFEGDLVPEGRPSPGAALSAPIERTEDSAVFDDKLVLLIEDSEDNQTLIKHYLTVVGIHVDVANDGFSGLSKLAKANYDLIVLDIQMPGMDGHEVARALRERGCALPIVALTAHAFKEDREKAFRSGFNEYLTKPINRAVLLKTLGNRFAGLPGMH